MAPRSSSPLVHGPWMAREAYRLSRMIKAQPTTTALTWGFVVERLGNRTRTVSLGSRARLTRPDLRRQRCS
jgi:hypothetical protein